MTLSKEEVREQLAFRSGHAAGFIQGMAGKNSEWRESWEFFRSVRDAMEKAWKDRPDEQSTNH